MFDYEQGSRAEARERRKADAHNAKSRMLFRENTANEQQEKLPPRGYVCKLCGITGHWIHRCIHFEEKESMIQKRNNNLAPPGTYTCRLCKIPGHWIEDCKQFLPRSISKGRPKQAARSSALK